MSGQQLRDLRRCVAACLLAGLAALCSSPPRVLAAPADWVTKVVDAYRTFSDMSDRYLQVDAAGRLHLAYGGHHLYYATLDGADWALSTVDATSNAGRHASLALDPSGAPRIAYTAATGEGELRYAAWDGGSWYTETITTGIKTFLDAHTSITVDAQGWPWIAYAVSAGYANDLLMVAHRDAQGWQFEQVEKSWNAGSYAPLALDSVGAPHVAYHRYYGGANGILRYASRTPAGWQVETVDDAQSPGWHASLALDSRDEPHIAYYASFSEDLRYAHKGPAGWAVETLDDAGDVGRYASLALDGNDAPHISYSDFYDGALQYATRGEAG